MFIDIDIPDKVRGALLLLRQVHRHPVLDEGRHVRGAFLAAEIALRLLCDDGGYLAAAPVGGGGIQQGAYELRLLREGRIEEYPQRS